MFLSGSALRRIPLTSLKEGWLWYCYVSTGRPLPGQTSTHACCCTEQGKKQAIAQAFAGTVKALLWPLMVCDAAAAIRGNHRRTSQGYALPPSTPALCHTELHYSFCPASFSPYGLGEGERRTAGRGNLASLSLAATYACKRRARVRGP